MSTCLILLSVRCFFLIHLLSLQLTNCESEVTTEEVVSIKYDSEYVIDLNESNLGLLAKENEILFINFLVSWCPFSRKFGVVFDDVAEKCAHLYDAKRNVTFVRANCETEIQLCKRFNVNKYPTLKILIYGKQMKQEYRGQRTTAAILSHIEELLKDPIEYMTKESLPTQLLDQKKPTIIRYADSGPGNNSSFFYFRKVASAMRFDCHFFWVSSNSGNESHVDTDHVEFRPVLATEMHFTDHRYQGRLDDYKAFVDWTRQVCSPIVKEINFANAEEIVEEGLPLLILFIKDKDITSVEIFHKAIMDEIHNETELVSFNYAVGDIFKYTLQRILKTTKDLPLIVLDDFSHMYQLNFTALQTPGLLRTFINDLHSGKLHLAYHEDWMQALGNVLGKSSQSLEQFVQESGDEGSGDKAKVEGDKADTESESAVNEIGTGSQGNGSHEDDELYKKQYMAELPAESTFKMLAPSDKRYTFRRRDGENRDEL